MVQVFGLCDDPKRASVPGPGASIPPSPPPRSTVLHFECERSSVPPLAQSLAPYPYKLLTSADSSHSMKGPYPAASHHAIESHGSARIARGSRRICKRGVRTRSGPNFRAAGSRQGGVSPGGSDCGHRLGRLHNRVLRPTVRGAE